MIQMFQLEIRLPSLLLGLLWAGAIPLVADSLDLAPQYRSRSWQREQGLPQSSVHALSQDRAGYLWLATENGLVRFDGYQFTVLNAKNTAEISDSHFRALLIDQAGDLWVGGRGGLLHFKDGQIRKKYTTDDGLPYNFVSTLHQDSSGDLWIGTYGGLARFDGHGITAYKTSDGLPHDSIEAIGGDRNGGVWVATDQGLCRYSNGRFHTFTADEGLISN